MPPKKKVSADGAEVEGGPFKWEGPNDNKLLLLTQGRYVKPDEYEQLTQAFPGTTIGSIRNRISALRVKQRDLYTSLTWDLPDGAAGYSNKKNAASTPKKATPKKRLADESGDAEEGEVETPVKKERKPRAKKAKKAKKEEVKERSDGEVEDPVEEVGGVKQEALDEEV